ncbi:palmitoyl-protein thioesterase [Marasmius fiardii PR-910]|nr:palmitoyl-protein thioesterase [Marasmius fiardii PR-910]
MILSLIFVALLATLSLASPAKYSKKPRPLVIWHGMGDSYASPGLLEFFNMIRRIHPGIFIHSIYIEKELDKDRQATFYGNVDNQIELVSKQLAEVPELAGGFDAIGFSQGGQFLRAYVERSNTPPIRNLITFGSQHMGVSDVAKCGRFDIMCQVARRAVKAGVYSEWAQQNLVQAQYYRDPANLPQYLATNKFLTSINNEIPGTHNKTYAANLASLDNLVLVLFTEDTTVIPKESAWFGSEVIEDEFHVYREEEIDYDEENFNGQERLGKALKKSEKLVDRTILPMKMQPLYREDWIGLKKLDEKNGVVFDVCEGAHMQIGECWEPLVRRWVGELV